MELMEVSGCSLLIPGARPEALGSVCQQTVMIPATRHCPSENSVQPMGNVIPPAGLRRSSSLRPCLSLVEETRRRTRLQGA
jgi:hypothetical protein